MSDKPKVIHKNIHITIRVRLPASIASVHPNPIETRKSWPIAKHLATNSYKTKKKKVLLTNREKIDMWNKFDTKKTVLPNIYEIKTKDATTCGLCKGYIMIMEDGFPTCSSCGIIDLNILDHSPEWRFYGSDDKHGVDPTRCGNPINPLLVESSFGCKVLCTSGTSYDMRKIRTWTEWQSMPHREKSLYDEFQFITQMAQNSGIPKIFIDDAIQMHKTISERKMLRGLNRDGIKAASIYLSCRKNECPRTAHEIAEIFHLDKASATNGCSMAVNILHDIERGNEGADSCLPSAASLCSTTPSSFIERYCSKLNMSVEYVRLGMFIAKKIELGHLINDNAPDSIAAGVVYFLSQLCRLAHNKNDIKNICGVSEVTINKCFKKIESMKDIVVPAVILQKYSA